MDILVDPPMYIADDQQEMSVSVNAVDSHFQPCDLSGFGGRSLPGFSKRGPLEATEKNPSGTMATLGRFSGRPECKMQNAKFTSAALILQFILCILHFAIASLGPSEDAIRILAVGPPGDGVRILGPMRVTGNRTVANQRSSPTSPFNIRRAAGHPTHVNSFPRI